MSWIDRAGKIQNTLGFPNNFGATTVNGRVAFGATVDVAKNMPQNPGAWNDTLEKGRQGAMGLAQANPLLTGAVLGGVVGGPVGAAAGVAAGGAILGVDKVTGGAASEVLQLAPKNLRSNYAFVRDVSEKNAAMGILTGLTMVAGGILGGIAGIPLGPAGIAAGAAIGVGLTGKAERDLFKSELGANVNKTLSASAKLAGTRYGQEKYNFGRDIVRNTFGNIPGFEYLGDTSKGFGAITSGALNFGFEVTAGMDIAAGKAAGAVARKTLVRPITEPMTGFSRVVLSKSEAARTAQRVEEEVDLIKRTVAGEETPYTPVFKFYNESKGYELAARKEFDSEVGQVAAHLFAGKSFDEIGLLRRVGIGDVTAVEELAARHASTFAEYSRYDDALRTVSKDGIIGFEYQGKTLALSKKFTDNIELVKAEADSLKKEFQWLDSALDLEGGMKDRTVSRWAYVEKIRNDFAKEAAARNVSGTANFVPETGIGKVYQWAYQKSPLSATIRGIDRATNDAPEGIINFNEPVMANTRLASSLREAEKVRASVPENNIRVFDNWSAARTEAEKMNIIDEYSATGFAMLGKKHGIAPAIVEHVIDSYIRNHRLYRESARQANTFKQGYMNDPQNPSTLISDPVLITQLSNGALLPNWTLADKAFAEFAKRNGKEASMFMKSKDGARIAADELNALWRSGTLLRSGYPINVIKDAHIRAWGDAMLFDVWKYLGQDAIQVITNSSNTINRIGRWTGSKVNKNDSIGFIRDEINARQTTLDIIARELKTAKYDVKNPPKKVPDNLLANVESYNELQTNLKILRAKENALVSGIKDNRVKPQTIEVNGEVFEAAGAGRFGQLFMSKIAQKEDLRRAMASVKELGIENMRRSRTGSRAVLPTDEGAHLVAWEQILNDKMRFDPVARMILEKKSDKAIVEYLKSPEGFNYLDRFSASKGDAIEIYDRVKSFVDMYAPSQSLRDAIISDKLTVLELKKLYPDVNQRPPVFSDMADDMLGTSNVYIKGRELVKEGIAWLSTQPTSKLAFSPYFRAKYEQELQSQMFIAKGQNKVLTLEDKARFERRAREYALREYREKLNSFHRNMNYSGITNYLLAFFPAVVEQFRAYARITLEHPDFVIKKLKFAELPSQISEVQQDPNGNEYFEVDLPYFGLKTRVPTSWFNPDNPTGGDIISAHPFVVGSVNKFVNVTNIENRFTDIVLPYGAQKNSLNAVTPNTVRRLSQLFSAKFKQDGEQFNKDVKLFSDQLRFEYVRDNGKEPSNQDWADIFKTAQKQAFYTSVLRFVSSATLPVQGRMVTGITAYADIFTKYQEKFGAEATEQFRQDYPDYYMVTDRLTDPISGIIPDKTSARLVKRNLDSVLNIVSGIGPNGDLTTLGAIFNDEDYAFSPAAQNYLSSTKIPGTNKKFRDLEDAFGQGRASIVSKGWNDFFKVKEIVTQVLKEQDPPVDPTSKYAEAIISRYKNAFVESQKTQNPIWYNEYEAQSRGGANSRQANTITALTIAVEDDKLWGDLSKQPKWELILNYLQFRYGITKKLQAMGTTIDAQKAYGVRQEVGTYVAQMRLQNTEFAKFYDRYFENDKFDFVYEGKE